ncbi:histidine-rich glycoprotein-like [Fagus crenata]
MASMQCYKPAYETCQQKCQDSSHGHRVADMASWGMKGNHHQGHDHAAGYGMANSETYRYGQTHAYYPDHNMAKTQQAQYYGQTQSHYPPDHTMSKTHQSYSYHSQTNGQHPSDHHAIATHGHAYGHGQAYGHHASSCHSKTEKKMKEKGCEYKKEKILYKKKSKSSKKSCSDNDSGSDSD